MSSKFSKPSLPLKPPPVCNKSPKDLPDIPPAINDQQILAILTLDLDIYGNAYYGLTQLILDPTEPDYRWSGTTMAGPFVVAVTADYDKDLDDFSAHLTVSLEGIVQADVTAPPSKVRMVSPLYVTSSYLSSSDSAVRFTAAFTPYRH